MKRPDDCCKAYTIHARHGVLTLSETPNRLAIEVSIADGEPVYLNKTQFATLCGLDSSYDGLEINDAPEPEAEPEEEDEDVTVA